MYVALQNEFQSDKAAKSKADQVEIPKNNVDSYKRKKEDTPVYPAKKEEPAKVVEPVLEKVSEPIVVVEAPKVEVVEEKAPEPVVAPVLEKVSETIVVAEVPKVEEHHIEGPKIIAKIDLNAIDSSTRPKKASKKAEPVVVTEVTPETVAENAPVTEEVVKPVSYTHLTLPTIYSV